ncbi:VOC family protein [soil metagenome]|jgi:catechol 2,3-dioxygenase-like lactoylglutathione lyase family enzyme
MGLNIDIVTVAVDDVTAATRFYEQALGWTPALAVEGEVTFLRAGSGRMLALFGRSDLVTDAGAETSDIKFDLGHICADPQEVDEVTRRLQAGGAEVLKAPQEASWGGYHAYLRIPDGTIWEIAHNPGWSVDDNGDAQIRPVN